MKYIRNNKNKKGFTLVELIVVMSIIGILVLLAAPVFIGKTEEATRTKHFATVRVLEDAAERYFIDHGKWPRGEEEPYTPEEVSAYAERIYDITGEEVVLEEGHYWDIDYEALSKYAKLPAKKDRDNYVVRNPVGKIYYLEGLNEEDKEVIDSSKNIPVETEEEAYQRRLKGEIARVTAYEGSGEEIVFHGLSPAAFDGTTATYHIGAGTVTWEGDLADRELSITGKGNSYNGTDYNLTLTFYNGAGEVLKPVNSSESSTTVSGSYASTGKAKVVVPEGAVKMVFSGGVRSTYMTIYDISLPTATERPQNVNVSSVTTPSSVTLTWDKVNRAIIYKDGALLKDVKSAQTFTDMPLYADIEQVYDIVFMDSYGNGQKVQYKVTTPKHIVAFRGLTPAAFDGTTATYHSGVGTVTWEGDLSNREISITGEGSRYDGTPYLLTFTFQDMDGNIIKPVNASQDSTTVSNSYATTGTAKVVVPEGAVKMVFDGGNRSAYVKIYDISLPTTTERPQNVNVSSTTTPSSVTLTWDTVNRAIIYKNGTLLREVKGAQDLYRYAVVCGYGTSL